MDITDTADLFRVDSSYRKYLNRVQFLTILMPLPNHPRSASLLGSAPAKSPHAAILAARRPYVVS